VGRCIVISARFPIPPRVATQRTHAITNTRSGRSCTSSALRLAKPHPSRITTVSTRRFEAVTLVVVFAAECERVRDRTDALSLLAFA